MDEGSLVYINISVFADAAESLYADRVFHILMYLVHDIAKITKTNRFHPILVEHFHFSPLIENKFLISAIYVPVKKQQNAIYSKGNR